MICPVRPFGITNKLVSLHALSNAARSLSSCGDDCLRDPFISLNWWVSHPSWNREDVHISCESSVWSSSWIWLWYWTIYPSGVGKLKADVFPLTALILPGTCCELARLTLSLSLYCHPRWQFLLLLCRSNSNDYYIYIYYICISILHFADSLPLAAPALGVRNGNLLASTILHAIALWRSVSLSLCSPSLLFAFEEMIILRAHVSALKSLGLVR